MTKREFIESLSRFDDDADMDEVYEALREEREELIERIEERQHNSGMYAQQDLIAMYRRER